MAVAVRSLRNITSKYVRAMCTQSTDSTVKPSGFAQAFDKFAELPNQKINEPPKAPVSFAKLLRNSKLVDLGDPEGKIVTGKIFHIVDNDLYIDFGWKFHCVCPKPQQNSDKYVRGTNVRLRIRDLELSTRFLGSERDLTILEADAILLGLVERQ